MTATRDGPAVTSVRLTAVSAIRDVVDVDLDVRRVALERDGIPGY